MKDHKYRDFIAWGITAFITIVLCILFFFAIYKLQDLHAFGQTISAILQPISIGAVILIIMIVYQVMLNKKETVRTA